MSWRRPGAPPSLPVPVPSSAPSPGGGTTSWYERDGRAGRGTSLTDRSVKSMRSGIGHTCPARSQVRIGYRPSPLPLLPPLCRPFFPSRGAAQEQSAHHAACSCLLLAVVQRMHAACGLSGKRCRPRQALRAQRGGGAWGPGRRPWKSPFARSAPRPASEACKS